MLIPIYPFYVIFRYLSLRKVRLFCFFFLRKKKMYPPYSGFFSAVPALRG